MDFVVSSTIFYGDDPVGKELAPPMSVQRMHCVIGRREGMLVEKTETARLLEIMVSGDEDILGAQRNRALTLCAWVLSVTVVIEHLALWGSSKQWRQRPCLVN